MPWASSAVRMAASVGRLADRVPSCASKRLIVGTETPDFSAEPDERADLIMTDIGFRDIVDPKE